MSKNFKTVKKLALVLAMGSLSVGAFASSNPGGEDTELTFSPTGTVGSVVVKAWNLEASAPATIKVLNRWGRAVYAKALEGGADHQKRYDFSQLKSGRYTLVLESQTKTVGKPFVVGMNGVVREDNRETLKSFVPRIKQKSNEAAVRITFENPVNDVLWVQLLDEKDRVLYSEKVAGKQSYAKSINMKELPRGFYRVKVSNHDYRHTASVSR